jgi:hypothetical protein
VTTVKFTTPAGTLLASIKPDKVADFEWLLAAYLEALKKSEAEADRQVAANLRIYKATEPAPGGASVLYVLVIDPVVPEADYSWQDLLARTYAAFPDEAQAIYEKGTAVHAGPMSKLSLTPVTPSMTPPPPDAAGAAPGAATPDSPADKAPPGPAAAAPRTPPALSPAALGTKKPPQD